MLSNLFVVKKQHDKYIMDTTLYDELELEPNCSQDEIKQKFRILAKIHHPDKGGSEEKFKKIKLAYDILGDVEKRAHYDSTGEHYQENEIDNEVLSRLANLVSHHTQHINPDIDDLILTMKVDIYEAQRHTNKAINDCDNSIRKFNIISKKIKLKKDSGENLLKSIVETGITQKENELAIHKKTMLVFIKMLDILENYHYGIEDWQLFINK
jgi:curved DNA-binding protein CbpA